MDANSEIRKGVPTPPIPNSEIKFMWSSPESEFGFFVQKRRFTIFPKCDIKELKIFQSLANEDYDSEDDDDSSCDPTPSKLSISQVCLN